VYLYVSNFLKLCGDGPGVSSPVVFGGGVTGLEGLDSFPEEAWISRSCLLPGEDLISAATGSAVAFRWLSREGVDGDSAGIAWVSLLEAFDEVAFEMTLPRHARVGSDSLLFVGASEDDRNPISSV